MALTFPGLNQRFLKQTEGSHAVAEAVALCRPGKRYEFNLDHCKGCGICASECPCGAIVMEPENI